MRSKRSLRPILCVLFLFCILSACGSNENDEKALSSSPCSSSSSSSSSSLSITVGTYQPEPDREAPAPEAETLSFTVYTVKTLASVPVYPSPEPVDPIRTLPAGEILEVAEEGGSLWYVMETDDGQAGYLYGEALYPLDETGQTSSQSLAWKAVEERLSSLREQLPEGKYWNHMGQDIPFGEETPFSVTDTPCEHSIYGETYCNLYNGATLSLFPEYGYLCQCLGFASLLSDQIFGQDAPLSIFYDFDLLRPGDEIRLDEYEHSMIITDKGDDYVVVAEVNADYEDCLISWSRQLERWELEELSWDLEYISRYPMVSGDDGSWITWEEWENS